MTGTCMRMVAFDSFLRQPLKIDQMTTNITVDHKDKINSAFLGELKFIPPLQSEPHELYLRIRRFWESRARGHMTALALR